MISAEADIIFAALSENEEKQYDDWVAYYWWRISFDN